MAELSASRPTATVRVVVAARHLTVEERVARGRAARQDAPRSSHGRGSPPDRPDPVALLEQQAATRVPDWSRSATAGCWSRRSRSSGAPRSIMAADLAGTPRSGRHRAAVR